MVYPDFGKDLFLYHQILSTLRNVGMTITATGSDEKGMTPLYEFKIGYSFLSFGTLVGLLNNPEDFKLPPGQINYLQNRKTVKSEIKIKDYDFDVVAKAIDKLHFEGEIKKDVDSDWTDVSTKTIKLTEKGLSSLYENKYLKEYQKIDYAGQIHTSTLNTGLYTRRNIRIGWILGTLTFALVVANLWITLNKSSKETAKSKADSLQQSKTLQVYEELNQRLKEISQHLSDTAKVKVKIEK